jgi:hypothetical protein
VRVVQTKSILIKPILVSVKISGIKCLRKLLKLFNDQVKENEMGRACSTNGEEEECI